jgi:hypothetical protein
MPIESGSAEPQVLRLGDSDQTAVAGLLQGYGLELVRCASNSPIPGSYWGDDEAGLKRNQLYARDDTPLHSILHEACHYICMTPLRRGCLDTNAGSDVAEENAVCYLQILLAQQLPDFGRARMFADMDAWGYSFRLGSSRAWFDSDAEDARLWLQQCGLVDQQMQPAWRLRGCETDNA